MRIDNVVVQSLKNALNETGHDAVRIDMLGFG